MKMHLSLRSLLAAWNARAPPGNAGFSTTVTEKVIAAVFLVWSAAFIFRSSFVGIDGRRHFCLFDDAMISMRYAWNFSHGLGLVWNSGERVQGYTNFFMTILMSLATLVFSKSMAVLSIQVIGAAFMLGTARAASEVAELVFERGDQPHRVFIRVLAFASALAYYPLCFWSLMGMETGLLTLTLTTGVLFALRFAQRRRPTLLFVVALCLGLAYLTRADALVLGVAVWAFLAWEIAGPGADRKSLLHLLAACGLYLAFVVGLSMFQRVYYGQWLPNTYTLKLTGMPLSARLRDGVGFVTPFVTSVAPLMVLSGLHLGFAFTRRKLLIVVLALSSLAYQVYVGGDPWSYWRIMSPAIPLALVLFLHAAHATAVAASKMPLFRAYFVRRSNVPRRYALEIFVVTLALTGLYVANKNVLSQALLVNRPYKTKDNQRNIDTAILLNRWTTSKATIGVVWAGAIPYYTDRKAYDFYGKSDAYIARLPPDLSGEVSWDGMQSVPGHNKYDLTYSIQRLMPTYVEIVKVGQQDLSLWSTTWYERVEAHGITLFFLKGSPDVLWDKIDIDVPSGRPR